MAWLAAHWGIPLRQLALGHGFAWLEGAVMAGVKLVPFGQQAAQTLLRDLGTELPAALDQALALADDQARWRPAIAGHCLIASRNPIHPFVPFLRTAFMQSYQQPLRVGVGGPVGSGKTALLEALCKAMRDHYQIAVVTNDIYTKEDQRILTEAGALEPERIVGVETGGCPHTAIREDASMNLAAVEALARKFGNLEVIFVESGGDNLSATFSPEPGRPDDLCDRRG